LTLQDTIVKLLNEIEAPVAELVRLDACFLSSKNLQIENIHILFQHDWGGISEQRRAATPNYASLCEWCVGCGG
jgi:hypothetical protein